MVCFRRPCVHAVKSITGGASGSSSTLQPLFYGPDAATAAALSSVTALTPPWGVARERASARASTSAYLSGAPELAGARFYLHVPVL